jgi:type IV pilus assembly protein PilQ
MIINPKPWIATAVLAVTTASSPIALADGKNEVRAVTFDDSAGVTRVHVRGARTPTFTVYKLERPTRVVVDLPQAHLAETLRGHESSAAFTPSTWAVSTIAAQQLEDEAVRVIVTLARPGRYDVKTEGNEVIVTVMPRDPLPADLKANPAELTRVRAESDRMKRLASDAEVARQDALRQVDAASATLKQTRLEAEAAKAEAERLRNVAAEQAAKADAAQRAVVQAKQLQVQSAATLADLERAKMAAATAKREAEASNAAAAAAQIEAERTRNAAEKARRDALAEAESAKRDAAQAKDALAAKTVEASRVQAEANQKVAAAERSVEKERAEKAAANREAAAAVSAAEIARKEAAQVRLDASRVQAKAEAVQASAAADKKQAEADKHRAELARNDAEKAMREAKRQLEALDKKSAQAQQLEAKAREASTAAQGREAAARKAERKAIEERSAAELAVQAAKDARSRAIAADRAKAASESAAAEQRLAVARRATEQAQAERTSAEKAVREAKRELETTKSTLAGVEAQRAKAVATVRSGKPAMQIQAIRFRGEEGNGHVDIAVGDAASVQIGDASSTRVELIVDNAELASKLERTLDVSKFGSPVRAVSAFRDRRIANRVRLIAELAQPTTPTVDRDAGTVRWHFISGEIAKRPVRTKDMPSPVISGFGEASPPVVQQSVAQLQPQAGRRRIYHGATIDFDFKDAPIHDLLRVIADTGHVNIVVPDTIDAKVTVRLKRVPWDEALEVILASKGLWYRRDGNLYRIAPRKELDAEDEAEAARREAAVKAEAPRPEVVTLNYASSEDLKTKLEPMLSAKGKIETDGRTNALIVNDVGGNRAEIVRLALSLDTQTPQITIEARIVEARSTFVRQFGVQWGGNAIAGAAGGNATGLAFPSSIAIAGANEDNQTNRNGVARPSDFAVNMPATTGTGEGGALGFSLGSIGGNFNINLRLSALEDTGTVRIISAPKVTVLNNKEAMISQGVSIPISVVSAAGTNTQFVQADLALRVTPYVSQRDCAIAMNLVVTKNEADFVNVGARGDPTILRKEARTQMLVSDGDTAVLGGIYTRNTGLAYKKVPFFGDIPVLGWLFKNRRENDDRTEILVFITPKITNKATLPCVR